MKHHHFDPARLLRWLACDEGSEDSPALCAEIAHLAAGCQRCERVLLAYFDLTSLAELEGLEAPWLELSRRREAAEARMLLAWLDHLPPASRAEEVSDLRLHRPQLAEALLARCRARWSDQPEAARADAELATLLVPHLVEDAPGYLPEFDQAPLAARAWAHLGNALRIASDLDGAERALERAQMELPTRSVGRAVRAEVLSLLASLEIDRRRFAAARWALEEVGALYGRCNAWHEVGRTFLKLAKLEKEAGEPAAALEAVRQAMPLLDPQQQPMLSYAAANVQVNALCDLHQFDEAAALLPEAILLCEQHAGRLERVRMRWCESLIAAGRRQAEAAERGFLEVRRAFLAESMAYDAALVTLDLAALYTTMGRRAEVSLLAAEIEPIFQRLGIRREAAAARALLA
jgi:tetratricopeptide (TPR) repeat protein